MAYDQSSFLSISLMVVDDDPVFLQVMSRMLEKSRFRDPSIKELTIVAAKDSMDALSTLKIQRNNIDLIVTDYYMPGMNGLQLKSEITRKFGNLPVIVMSADANKEQESISCGALCFLPKPIKAMDLTKIYEVAITCKRNGKSILLTDHKDNKDTTCHVITSRVPKQIRLIPHEQLNDTKTKKLLSRSDSRSMNSTTKESCVIISNDGSRKNQERIKLNGGSCGNVGSLSRRTKKNKITWTDFLHDRFLQAIRHLGLDKAVPKKILEFMNVSYLTRENVASHLQKYRIFLRKVAEKGMTHSTSWSDTSDLTEMYNYFKNSNSWYDTTTLNDRSFYSRAIQNGFGQSRLLSNTREPFCFNQRSPYYNYMNRSSSTYEPRHLGSALTLPPFTSNINFSNQSSQSELGRQSFLEPQVLMANKTNQTSKLLEFGHHGSSGSANVSGFNSNMVMDYGRSTFNQPGLSNYGSSILNQQGLNYYGRLTPNQPELDNFDIATPNQLGLSNNGMLTSNQLGLSNNGSLTLNQPGLSNNGSLTPNQLGLSNNGSLTPNQLGLSNNGSLTPNQPGLSNNGSLTPNQPGLSNNGSLTPNQPGLSNNGSLTPNQLGLSNNGSLTPNQLGLSNNGSLTHNQRGLNNNGSSTLNRLGLSNGGSLTPNQIGLSNNGSLTPKQPRFNNIVRSPTSQSGLSSYGSSAPNQLGLSNYGSSTFINQQDLNDNYGSLTDPNQAALNNFESLAPNQAGPSNFSYAMQSTLLNNACQPQGYGNAATQSNVEISELENLNLFGDFDNTNELPWYTSYFQVDQNKQQGEAAPTTEFELPANFSELNQIFSLEGDVDWTFMNTNQDNGESSNTFAAHQEMDSTIFNMSFNHNQGQDVSDLIDWSLLEPQVNNDDIDNDLVDEDFMDSLFNNDMY